MGFGDRFNEWLIETGREPLGSKEITWHNEAGARVAAAVAGDVSVLAYWVHRMVADLVLGNKVDPAEYVRRALIEVDKNGEGEGVL